MGTRGTLDTPGLGQFREEMSGSGEGKREEVGERDGVRPGGRTEGEWG